MLREGVNKTQTSKALKRNISTIKREIKRGSVIQRRENPYAGRNKNVPDYPEEKVYFWDVGQRGYEKKEKTAVPETRRHSAVKWWTFEKKDIGRRETVTGYGDRVCKII